MPQQVHNDRDLKKHQNSQSLRWTTAVTSCKCIGAYAGIAVGGTAVGLLIAFVCLVVIDYYAMVRLDPKKLEAFVNFFLSHSVSFALGVIPPIVYIKSKH